MAAVSAVTIQVEAVGVVPPGQEELAAVVAVTCPVVLEAVEVVPEILAVPEGLGAIPYPSMVVPAERLETELPAVREGLARLLVLQAPMVPVVVVVELPLLEA